MAALPILLAGYSIFCAAAIALTHVLPRPSDRSRVTSKLMGLALLAALAVLQIAHVAWLYADLPWPSSLAYRMALFAVAPSFYLYSRALLQPGQDAPLGAKALLHLAPVLVAPLLPAALAQPLAFVVGAGYLLWLGRRLLALRAERARFRIEAVLLGVTFLVAVAVAILALLPALLPGKLFTALYACAIGLAFLLVQATLHLRPQLEVEVAEVAEAAQSAYVQTTLAKVDCDAALARLAALMQSERLYEDPALSLPALAARMGLSTHQVSELLNTRLGKRFARYVREQRIEAAKAMLCSEPSASVLSVGLSVGFSAQSNFYDAFREIEGSTPGQYRKLHLRPAGRA